MDQSMPVSRIEAKDDQVSVIVKRSTPKAAPVNTTTRGDWSKYSAMRIPQLRAAGLSYRDAQAKAGREFRRKAPNTKEAVIQVLERTKTLKRGLTKNEIIVGLEIMGTRRSPHSVQDAIYTLVAAGTITRKKVGHNFVHTLKCSD